MTTTETAPEPQAGQCLVCSASWPSETPSGAVGRHLVEPEQLGNHAEYAEKFGGKLVCLGSGHTRRHDDGHDEARLFGIRNCAHAEHQALVGQVKMNGLDFARGLDYRGTHVLVHRHLAALWREFAVHGQWPTGVCTALRFALVEAPSGDPMRQAIRHCQAFAARQWLREAKWELQRYYDRTGVPADDFADMLFGV